MTARPHLARPRPARAPRPALRTRVVTDLLERLGRRPVEDSDLDDIRAKRETVYPTRAPFTWITGPVGRGVRVETASAPVRDGARIPLRCYLPAMPGPLPLLVFFHGGGWVQGSTAMYDPLCSRLAEQVGAVVVSVDYRMAPEHLFPTAAHDAVDVVSWLVEHGASLPVLADADLTRVGLAGDSAGGNLGAVVAQQLRDLRGPDGEPVLRHQALIYPATDLTMSSPSIDEHADGPVLTRAGITAFRALYLDGTLGVREDHRADPRHRDPLASPLAGDATGVAPALVQAGELDPLRDDATRYAEHLAEAGVPVRCTTYRRLPHGFASMPGACPGADAAHAELVGEIAHHLHASVGSQRPLAVGDAEDQEHAQ